MKYDVIVCGAGPSGMCAAISARRNNAKVLLVEASGILGGANTLSLVGPLMTFHNNKHQVIKGIADEIITKLVERNQSFGYVTDPIEFCDTITPVDDEGLKQLYFDFIVEEGIDLLLHASVIDVIREENTIKGIKVSTKSGILELFGTTIIDATGDGDVCNLMGCDSVFGRSSDNLAQPMTMLFSVGNIDFDKIKEYIKENKEDFVLTDHFDYHYYGLSGFFKKVQEAKDNNDFDIVRDRVLMFQDVHPNQATINMTRVQKLRGSAAFDLTKAEIEGRVQIKKAFNFLKKYIPGFENSYIVKTPTKIGVRETRHIIGEYLIDSDDILNLRQFEDSICLSAFPIDIHSPNSEKLEFFEQSQDKCYEIPMRVLIPKGVNNLIVTGRCISATHEACASLRVTPTVMALGQAAGVLGAISAQRITTPKLVPYQEVQEILQKQGQIIKRKYV